MTLQGGDPEYGNADEFTVEFNDGTDGTAGDSVEVTGHNGTEPQVQLVSGNGQPDGVIADDAVQNDHVTIRTDGAFWTAVDDADDVAAGDTVGDGGTGNAGELDDTASDYTVLEGETAIGGDQFALVLWK